MSSVANQAEKRAADRKAQAMKMNYTKVKPTVVKHILPDEVMSIYDQKVSRNNSMLFKIFILGALILNYFRRTKSSSTCTRWIVSNINSLDRTLFPRIARVTSVRITCTLEGRTKLARLSSMNSREVWQNSCILRAVQRTMTQTPLMRRSLAWTRLECSTQVRCSPSWMIVRPKVSIAVSHIIKAR